MKGRRASDRVVYKQKVPHRICSLFHQSDNNGVGEQTFNSRKMEKISSEPSIYFIKDFLTPKEIEYFDKICTSQSFKKSYTEDDDNQKIISEERTSTYLHLSKSQDKWVRIIEQRAADLVGLNSACVEPLQIVSYTDGQKFELHHDAGTLEDDGTVSLVPPRRLVTFFLYLNDLPEGQGHTEFPALHPPVSVQPKRGCGVLFCNVMPSGDIDPRVVHQANPVAAGLRKYGINIWLSDDEMTGLALERPTVNVSQIPRYKTSSSALLQAQALTMQYQRDHPVASEHHSDSDSDESSTSFQSPARSSSSNSSSSSSSSSNSNSSSSNNQHISKYIRSPVFVSGSMSGSMSSSAVLSSIYSKYDEVKVDYWTEPQPHDHEHEQQEESRESRRNNSRAAVEGAEDDGQSSLSSSSSQVSWRYRMALAAVEASQRARLRGALSSASSDADADAQLSDEQLLLFSTVASTAGRRRKSQKRPPSHRSSGSNQHQPQQSEQQSVSEAETESLSNVSLVAHTEPAESLVEPVDADDTISAQLDSGGEATALSLEQQLEQSRDFELESVMSSSSSASLITQSSSGHRAAHMNARSVSPRSQSPRPMRSLFPPYAITSLDSRVPSPTVPLAAVPSSSLEDSSLDASGGTEGAEVPQSKLKSLAQPAQLNSAKKANIAEGTMQFRWASSNSNNNNDISSPYSSTSSSSSSSGSRPMLPPDSLHAIKRKSPKVTVEPALTTASGDQPVVFATRASIYGVGETGGREASSHSAAEVAVDVITAAPASLVGSLDVIAGDVCPMEMTTSEAMEVSDTLGEDGENTTTEQEQQQHHVVTEDPVALELSAAPVDEEESEVALKKKKMSKRKKSLVAALPAAETEPHESSVAVEEHQESGIVLTAELTTETTAETTLALASPAIESETALGTDASPPDSAPLPTSSSGSCSSDSSNIFADDSLCLSDVELLSAQDLLSPQNTSHSDDPAEEEAHIHGINDINGEIAEETAETNTAATVVQAAIHLDAHPYSPLRTHIDLSEALFSAEVETPVAAEQVEPATSEAVEEMEVGADAENTATEQQEQQQHAVASELLADGEETEVAEAPVQKKAKGRKKKRLVAALPAVSTGLRKNVPSDGQQQETNETSAQHTIDHSHNFDHGSSGSRSDEQYMSDVDLLTSRDLSDTTAATPVAPDPFTSVGSSESIVAANDNAGPAVEVSQGPEEVMASSNDFSPAAEDTPMEIDGAAGVATTAEQPMTSGFGAEREFREPSATASITSVAPPATAPPSRMQFSLPPVSWPPLSALSKVLSAPVPAPAVLAALCDYGDDEEEKEEEEEEDDTTDYASIWRMSLMTPAPLATPASVRPVMVTTSSGASSSSDHFLSSSYRGSYFPSSNSNNSSSDRYRTTSHARVDSGTTTTDLQCVLTVSGSAGAPTLVDACTQTHFEEERVIWVTGSRPAAAPTDTATTTASATSSSSTAITTTTEQQRQRSNSTDTSHHPMSEVGRPKRSSRPTWKTRPPPSDHTPITNISDACNFLRQSMLAQNIPLVGPPPAPALRSSPRQHRFTGRVTPTPPNAPDAAIAEQEEAELRQQQEEEVAAAVAVSDHALDTITPRKRGRPPKNAHSGGSKDRSNDQGRRNALSFSNNVSSSGSGASGVHTSGANYPDEHHQLDDTYAYAHDDDDAEVPQLTGDISEPGEGEPDASNDTTTAVIDSETHSLWLKSVLPKVKEAKKKSNSARAVDPNQFQLIPKAARVTLQRQKQQVSTLHAASEVDVETSALTPAMKRQAGLDQYWQRKRMERAAAQQAAEHSAGQLSDQPMDQQQRNAGVGGARAKQPEHMSEETQAAVSAYWREKRRAEQISNIGSNSGNVSSNNSVNSNNAATERTEYVLPSSASKAVPSQVRMGQGSKSLGNGTISGTIGSSSVARQVSSTISGKNRRKGLVIDSDEEEEGEVREVSAAVVSDGPTDLNTEGADEQQQDSEATLAAAATTASTTAVVVGKKRGRPKNSVSPDRTPEDHSHGVSEPAVQQPPSKKTKPAARESETSSTARSASKTSDANNHSHNNSSNDISTGLRDLAAATLAVAMNMSQETLTLADLLPNVKKMPKNVGPNSSSGGKNVKKNGITVNASTVGKPLISSGGSRVASQTGGKERRTIQAVSGALSTVFPSSSGGSSGKKQKSSALIVSSSGNKSYNIHARNSLGEAYSFTGSTNNIENRETQNSNANNTNNTTADLGSDTRNTAAEPRRSRWGPVVNTLPAKIDTIVSKLEASMLGRHSSSGARLDRVREQSRRSLSSVVDRGIGSGHRDRAAQTSTSTVAASAVVTSKSVSASRTSLGSQEGGYVSGGTVVDSDQEDLTPHGLGSAAGSSLPRRTRTEMLRVGFSKLKEHMVAVNTAIASDKDMRSRSSSNVTFAEDVIAGTPKKRGRKKKIQPAVEDETVPVSTSLTAVSPKQRGKKKGKAKRSKSLTLDADTVGPDHTVHSPEGLVAYTAQHHHRLVSSAELDAAALESEDLLENFLDDPYDHLPAASASAEPEVELPEHHQMSGVDSFASYDDDVSEYFADQQELEEQQENDGGAFGDETAGSAEAAAVQNVEGDAAKLSSDITLARKSPFTSASEPVVGDLSESPSEEVMMEVAEVGPTPKKGGRKKKVVPSTTHSLSSSSVAAPTPAPSTAQGTPKKRGRKPKVARVESPASGQQPGPSAAHKPLFPVVPGQPVPEADIQRLMASASFSLMPQLLLPNSGLFNSQLVMNPDLPSPTETVSTTTTQLPPLSTANVAAFTRPTSSSTLSTLVSGLTSPTGTKIPTTIAGARATNFAITSVPPTASRRTQLDALSTSTMSSGPPAVHHSSNMDYKQRSSTILIDYTACKEVGFKLPELDRSAIIAEEQQQVEQEEEETTQPEMQQEEPSSVDLHQQQQEPEGAEDVVVAVETLSRRNSVSHDSTEDLLHGLNNNNNHGSINDRVVNSSSSSGLKRSRLSISTVIADTTTSPPKSPFRVSPAAFAVQSHNNNSSSSSSAIESAKRILSNLDADRYCTAEEVDYWAPTESMSIAAESEVQEELVSLRRVTKRTKYTPSKPSSGRGLRKSSVSRVKAVKGPVGSGRSTAKRIRNIASQLRSESQLQQYETRRERQQSAQVRVTVAAEAASTPVHIVDPLDETDRDSELSHTPLAAQVAVDGAGTAAVAEQHPQQLHAAQKSNIGGGISSSGGGQRYCPGKTPRFFATSSDNSSSSQVDSAIATAASVLPAISSRPGGVSRSSSLISVPPLLLPADQADAPSDFSPGALFGGTAHTPAQSFNTFSHNISSSLTTSGSNVMELSPTAGIATGFVQCDTLVDITQIEDISTLFDYKEQQDVGDFYSNKHNPAGSLSGLNGLNGFMGLSATGTPRPDSLPPAIASFIEGMPQYRGPPVLSSEEQRVVEEQQVASLVTSLIDSEQVLLIDEEQSPWSNDEIDILQNILRDDEMSTATNSTATSAMGQQEEEQEGEMTVSIVDTAGIAGTAGTAASTTESSLVAAAEVAEPQQVDPVEGLLAEAETSQTSQHAAVPQEQEEDVVAHVRALLADEVLVAPAVETAQTQQIEAVEEQEQEQEQEPQPHPTVEEVSVSATVEGNDDNSDSSTAATATAEVTVTSAVTVSNGELQEESAEPSVGRVRRFSELSGEEEQDVAKSRSNSSTSSSSSSRAAQAATDEVPDALYWDDANNQSDATSQSAAAGPSVKRRKGAK